jgi:6-phosphogluconolactonase
MKCLAESYKAFPAAGFLVLLILGFAGQAFADKKPKFVYVANSGETVDAFPGYRYQTFKFTATASCSNAPCESTVSISGDFTLDLYIGEARTGTIFLSDPSDLASATVALPLYLQTTLPYVSNVTLYFGQNTPAGPYADVTLALPFTYFPGTYYGSFLGTYTGGPICTSVSTSVCTKVSGVEIATNDMSPILRATTGGNPINLTITSGSVTLAGSTQGSNSVSGYAIDSTTGALTLLPGSPFAAGVDPHSLAVDPSNKFVYVANRGSNNISAYVVDSTTGALSPVPGAPFAAGLGPYSLAVDPSNKFVYVANQGSNNVSAYQLENETGALTPVSGSPFAAGTGPASVTVDPLGKFVFVSGANGISAYTIDGTTGALKSVPGSPFQSGADPVSVTVDPSDKFLYVADANYVLSDEVSANIINSMTGALTPVGVFAPGTAPTSVAADPSGKFLYATQGGPRNLYSSITAYTIDSTTGDLAQIKYLPYFASFPTEVDPVSVALDPSGKFAYVGNMGSNNISAYTIDGTTGALAPIAGSPFVAGVGPASVAIASASTVPFDNFKVKADIDEDRKTSFRVAGFFTLGKGSDGIYPLSESVQLQVGSFTATIPAGSFRQEGRHEFEFEGRIHDVELKITIYPVERKGHKEGKDSKEGKDFLFTAGGNGNILAGIANPVTVGLTIGDDEGSTTVKADIEK